MGEGIGVGVEWTQNKQFFELCARTKARACKHMSSTSTTSRVPLSLLVNARVHLVRILSSFFFFPAHLSTLSFVVKPVLLLFCFPARPLFLFSNLAISLAACFARGFVCGQEGIRTFKSGAKRREQSGGADREGRRPRVAAILSGGAASSQPP